MVSADLSAVGGVMLAPSAERSLLLCRVTHASRRVEFKLPEIAGSDQWSCLIDTNAPVREELPEFESGDVYQVTGRSLLLFALHAKGQIQRIFVRLERQLTEEGGEN
jgi:isoamylase